MAVFKCKMCGGALNIDPNLTVVECDYCGTKQTLPRLTDEKRTNLYERANQFRRNNEFDKAMTVYEQILSEDKTDAEAYWSLVLCRYGIEYVEDPKSHKRVPTVNRAQFTSVFADSDYKSSIKYADVYQSMVYQTEAKAIDEIQKGILEISAKEKPFDVFICYKESDANGRRTYDSVYAQDIYKALTEEGYKVFFSRITLEDKLGSAYEPYIFAALNSAKVMIVVGTKAEHLDAVWVKNEWSRYLSLIKAGQKKTLIPVYKDMDPYDLPKDFAYLQAQDMSKIGFMQDILHGIKKLISPVTDAAKNAVAVSEKGIIENTLKRAMQFLATNDTQSADRCLEAVLGYDPQNAEAYVGKLMILRNCQHMDQLADARDPFGRTTEYQQAFKNASSELKKKLIFYRQSALYNYASDLMNTQNAEKMKHAAVIFSRLGNFKDAKTLTIQSAETSFQKRAKANLGIFLSVAGACFLIGGLVLAFSLVFFQLHILFLVPLLFVGGIVSLLLSVSPVKTRYLFGKTKGIPKKAFLIVSLCIMFALAIGTVLAVELAPVKYELLKSTDEVAVVKYRGKQEELEIPTTFLGKKVTMIGDEAFSNATTLKRVVFPSELSYIGVGAMKNCSSLEYLSIPLVSNIERNFAWLFEENGDENDVPETLKYVVLTGGSKIPVSHFARYKNLVEVTIPASINLLDYCAFLECVSLQRVNFAPDSSLMWINDSAFRECEALESIEIPNSVLYMGESVFSGCKNLKTVSFEKNSTLEEISGWMFSGCSSLESIVLPASLKIIGRGGFSHSSFKSVEFENVVGWQTASGKVSLADPIKNAEWLREVIQKIYR